MIWRIFSVVILLVLACAFNVVLTVLFGILCIVVFDNFYEIIPIFFINDMLYGIGRMHFLHFQYCMTAFAVILVCGSYFFKKYVFEGSFIRR